MDANLSVRWTAEELLAATYNHTEKPLWMFYTTIGQYEYGDFLKALTYTHMYGSPVGYIGDGEAALGDLITMLRCAAALNGMDFWSAMRDGEEKFMERQERLKEELD